LSISGGKAQTDFDMLWAPDIVTIAKSYPAGARRGYANITCLLHPLIIGSNISDSAVKLPEHQLSTISRTIIDYNYFIWRPRLPKHAQYSFGYIVRTIICRNYNRNRYGLMNGVL